MSRAPQDTESSPVTQGPEETASASCLTTEEADRLLAEHGPNDLDEQRRDVLRKLLAISGDQFPG